MNDDAQPRIAPDLIWRLLDDNAVVVSPRVGEVRVLNGIGTVIWQQLIEQHSQEEIVSHLVDTYSVDRLQAEKDLHQFLEDLTERGVLVWEKAPDV